MRTAAPSSPAVDRHAMLEHARRLATPVDIPALVDAGVLRRRGRWYQVLDVGRLPDAARCHIRTMRSDAGAVLVRFRAPTQVAQQLYAELSGERGQAARVDPARSVSRDAGRPRIPRPSLVARVLRASDAGDAPGRASAVASILGMLLRALGMGAGSLRRHRVKTRIHAAVRQLRSRRRSTSATQSGR